MKQLILILSLVFTFNYGSSEIKILERHPYPNQGFNTRILESNINIDSLSYTQNIGTNLEDSLSVLINYKQRLVYAVNNEQNVIYCDTLGLFSKAFNSIDKEANKMPEYSPYLYCNADPINIMDPDGNEVIFVNGYIGFGSPEGGAKYWNGANSNFVNGAKKFFNDVNVEFLDIDHKMFSSAQNRWNNGYNYAKSIFGKVVSKLANGEILKFVSHSMGAAFSEGMAAYFLENGVPVSDIVHINPFQPDDITTVNPSDNSTRTTDYQNTDDFIIGKIPFTSPGDITGADYRIREQSGENDIFLRHKAPIFMDNGHAFWDSLRAKQIKSSFIDSPIIRIR